MCKIKSFSFFVCLHFFHLNIVKVVFLRKVVIYFVIPVHRTDRKDICLVLLGLWHNGSILFRPQTASMSDNIVMDRRGLA